MLTYVVTTLARRIAVSAALASTYAALILADEGIEISVSFVMMDYHVGSVALTLGGCSFATGREDPRFDLRRQGRD